MHSNANVHKTILSSPTTLVLLPCEQGHIQGGGVQTSPPEIFGLLLKSEGKEVEKKEKNEK